MIKKAIILALDDINKYLCYENKVCGIYNIINTLSKSGINDLLILISKNNINLIEFLGEATEYKVNICYKVQENMSVKNSINLCKSFTGKDSFVIVNGDNFFEDTFEKELSNFLCKSHIFKKDDTTTDLYIYTNHVYDVIRTFDDNINFNDINKYYLDKKDCCIKKIDGIWRKNTGFHSAYTQFVDGIYKNIPFPQ